MTEQLEEQVVQLARDTARLMDESRIRNLVYAYSYCIDTNRPADFLELFTDDCIFDPGPANGGAVRGRAAIGEVRARSSLVASSHHNSNVMIDFVDADRAQLRTSFYAWHRVRSGDQPLVWGYYDDIVVRVGSDWKFAERTIRVYGDQGFAVAWNPGERLLS